MDQASVRLVPGDPLDAQREVLGEANDDIRGSDGISDGRALDYRQQGINLITGSLNEALTNLIRASDWAIQVQAIPDHLRPLIRNLVHQCRRVADEAGEIQ